MERADTFWKNMCWKLKFLAAPFDVRVEKSKKKQRKIVSEYIEDR